MCPDCEFINPAGIVAAAGVDCERLRVSTVIGIRSARTDDAPAILEVLSGIISERQFLNSDAPPDPVRFVRFVRANLTAGAPFVVAVRDDRVIGWCDLLPSLQPSCQHTGRVGMGVKRDWRGRGIGREMLSILVSRAWAAGFTRLDLEVFTDNAGAIALYRSLGFVVEGEHRNVRRQGDRYQNTYTMALLR